MRCSGAGSRPTSPNWTALCGSAALLQFHHAEMYWLMNIRMRLAPFDTPKWDKEVEALMRPVLKAIMVKMKQIRVARRGQRASQGKHLRAWVTSSIRCALRARPQRRDWHDLGRARVPCTDIATLCPCCSAEAWCRERLTRCCSGRRASAQINRVASGPAKRLFLLPSQPAPPVGLAALRRLAGCATKENPSPD